MKLSQQGLRLLVLSGWILFVGIFYFVGDSRVGSVLSAVSPWTQTDWSGGQSDNLATGVVTTYKDVHNLDTDSGSLSLELKSVWYDTQWGYRKEITLDNTTANIGTTSEALINFPVLLTLNSSNFDYSKAKSDGSDIRFTDSDGSTALDYQIETWDVAGNSYVWVKVPQIDINSNTDKIYLYYGNSSASDAQNAASVWSNGFVGVWLLNDPQNTTTVLDSATDPSQENGTSLAGITNASKIQSGIGGALVFNALTTDYVTLGTPEALNLTPNSQEFTIDAWVKLPINATGTFFTKGQSTAANIQYEMYVSGNTLNSRVGGTARNSNLIIADGNWHHIVLRNYNSAGFKFSQYVDGTLGNTFVASGAGISTFDTLIGARRNTTNANVTSSLTLNTQMSMVRIANVARTPAWISATFKSEANDFVTLGTEEFKYESSGYLLSNIFDGEEPQDWGLLNYSSSGSGVLNVRARTGDQSDLSDAQQNWATCNVITNGSDISANNCVDDGDRYVQYRVDFSTTSAVTSVMEDFSIAFSISDVLAPATNATDISIANFSEADWIATEPTITWTEGTDNLNGSGIMGYCIALDEADPDSSHILDPEDNAGVLQGKDDSVASTACPYIATGANINISSIASLNLVAGRQYYFSIKAIDNSENIFSSTGFQDLISFKYDNQAPLPPSYVSLPTNFLSNKSVVMTWPVIGPGIASDEHSGLAGLQYRIGSEGTWYGDLHTGSQDSNDLLINDGSYSTDETSDYPSLLEGSNFVYIRAIDNLGNITAESEYTVGVIKINTAAPSAVQGLQVSPSTSDTNAYTFSWSQPSSFVGQAGGLKYCYTVNTSPAQGLCNFTDPGVTTLGPDAFATRPGSNTLYVVAQDEANNINYEVFNSVNFTYSGSAPGIPANLDIADISVKSTSNWRLVISWDAPTDIGAGIDHYDIYRSTVNTSCSSNFGAFSKVGFSTSASYINPDLEQKMYYFCIKACDSANNCSASSATSGRIPTGKFTESAGLITNPEALSVTTRKALIAWVTDRESDSRIEYGLESGIYFEEEVSNSAQLASHNITLNNLTPGTTYFYRAKWTDIDGNTGVSDEKSFITLPPPSVANVSTTSVTTNSAIVNFIVRNSTRTSLVYGTTESYGGNEVVATSTEESEYYIYLNGLADGTTYNYKFLLEDIDGNTTDTIINFQFTTLPLPEISNLRFEEVKNSTQPTIKIFWTTNVATIGYIDFHPKGNIDQKGSIGEKDSLLEHELTLAGLSANSEYELTVSARDSLGNTAISPSYNFTTAEDSRPPEISNIKVETRLSEASSEFGNEAFAQLVVTWDTDELSTTQVQFNQGTTGDFTQKTPLDENLTFNHLAVLTNLNPSSVYKLQVLSKDSTGNEAKGKNMVIISAQAKENPLSVILGRLSDVFGFIGQ